MDTVCVDIFLIKRGVEFQTGSQLVRYGFHYAFRHIDVQFCLTLQFIPGTLIVFLVEIDLRMLALMTDVRQQIGSNKLIKCWVIPFQVFLCVHPIVLSVWQWSLGIDIKPILHTFCPIVNRTLSCKGILPFSFRFGIRKQCRQFLLSRMIYFLDAILEQTLGKRIHKYVFCIVGVNLVS